MTQALKGADRGSFGELQKLLVHERELEVAHIREALAADFRDRETDPGDEGDFAQFLGSAVFAAGINERHNMRLAAIVESLKRLEDGDYGVCQECGEQIAVERLKAVPFTKYCRDCQADRERHGLKDERPVVVAEGYLEPSESSDESEEEPRSRSDSGSELERSAAKRIPRGAAHRRRAGHELKPDWPGLRRRRLRRNADAAS